MPSAARLWLVLRKLGSSGFRGEFLRAGMRLDTVTDVYPSLGGSCVYRLHPTPYAKTFISCHSKQVMYLNTNVHEYMYYTNKHDQQYDFIKDQGRFPTVIVSTVDDHRSMIIKGLCQQGNKNIWKGCRNGVPKSMQTRKGWYKSDIKYIKPHPCRNFLELGWLTKHAVHVYFYIQACSKWLIMQAKLIREIIKEMWHHI